MDRYLLDTPYRWRVIHGAYEFPLNPQPFLLSIAAIESLTGIAIHSLLRYG
jgi:hypothetical protein